MLQAGLRLEQAPPISVPFRFFLTAPVFIVLAAAVLLWRGPEVFDSRLSPAALAATHLFTLGVMAMVMMGAVMQMLPVLAGSPIPLPRATAAIAHAALSLGTPLLAAGFLVGAPWLLRTGASALAIGFAVFIAAVATSLWRTRVRTDTSRAILAAAVSLLATVVFGFALASGLGWGIALPNLSIRYLHPAWGMLGWLGLLAVGVAYQVVPMFQMTPAYPGPMTRYFAAAVFALLALWSGALWMTDGTGGPIADACALALAAGYVAFGAVTLALERRRRRRQPDALLHFWRAAMSSLIAANLLWAFRLVSPAHAPEALDVLIGLLALAGFAGSIINGMLYKIAPFLVWFHLRSLAGAGRPVPNMRQILGDADQRLQARVHFAALALLAAAAAWPSVLVYPAALALGASGMLLGANLIRTLLVFRGFARTSGPMPETARAC